MSGSDLKYQTVGELKLRLQNAKGMQHTWFQRAEAIKAELTKRSMMDNRERCPRCQGMGAYQFDCSKWIQCRICKGTGVVKETHNDPIPHNS